MRRGGGLNGTGSGSPRYSGRFFATSGDVWGGPAADGILSHDDVTGSVSGVAAAGDMDADGFPDLAVAVPRGRTESGSNQFYVFLFVGGAE